MYCETDLVGVAKRDQNNKRKYLVLNKLQGKHVPSRPQDALEMFGKLADAALEKYRGEKVLVVGFAETATAVGAVAAVRMKTPYLQTTREDMGDVEYLSFLEEHSHAMDQRLVKQDVDQIIGNIDRILFLEDEVTTGNTIMNIIREIREQYQRESVKFSVASILNGMDEPAVERFREENVECVYLLKTNHEGYEGLVDRYEDSGEEKQGRFAGAFPEIRKIQAGLDARRLVEGGGYGAVCESFAEELLKQVGTGESILVLGTEEFMYPGLYAAAGMEKRGNEVFFHATTRSPIIPCTEECYPVHNRCRLRSLYQEERKTFLYNLKKYDRVFIVTDAVCSQENKGLTDLLDALWAYGNQRIIIYEWSRA